MLLMLAEGVAWLAVALIVMLAGAFLAHGLWRKLNDLTDVLACFRDEED